MRIESVVDNNSEASSSLHDDMCHLCRMSVVWMENKLKQNQTEEKILDYIAQLLKNLKNIETIVREVFQLKSLKALWLNDNPILKEYGEIKGVDMNGIFDPGGIKSEFSLNTPTYHSVQSEVGMWDCTEFSNEHWPCLVTQTGVSTMIGRVHSQIHEASKNEENTLLKRKLNEFGEYLTAIIGIICVLVWLNIVRYFLPWELVNGGEMKFEKCTYYFEIDVALVAILEDLLVVLTIGWALGTSLLDPWGQGSIKGEVLVMVKQMFMQQYSRTHFPEFSRVNGDNLKPFKELHGTLTIAMWLYLVTYRLADEEKIDATSVWYVMDELGSSLWHSDEPNFEKEELQKEVEEVMKVKESKRVEVETAALMLVSLESIPGSLFRSDDVKHVLVGLMRDLRGIAMATSSRRTYGFPFDWLYPAHMPLILEATTVWADVSEVTTPILKFITGVFDLPFTDRTLLDVVGCKAHRELACEAVRKSLVLLKNGRVKESRFEPEICKVHLGIAVLMILALGIKDVQSFDFVDAPSPKGIEMAIKKLIHLGAITCIEDGYELTAEGLVLVPVMANSNNIFCRVGAEVDKLKSDCLKVQFFHHDGDLFTLLFVYKELDAVSQEKKNAWCEKNSINAKTMRRCQETVEELEACLQNELSIVVPTYWHWDPHMHTEHDETLKHIILSSLSENVAMFSGYDQLGYEVALAGKHVKLHPSCSLLNFCQRPTWVVFGDILASAKEYLVCVTAFDFHNLATLFPPPLFDFLKMDAQKLQKKSLTGFGSMLLKRLCGKSNCHINRFVSRMRTLCMDERIGIEVNVDQNEIAMYASSRDMDRVFENLNEAVDYEYKLLKNECLEKCLYNGGSASSVPTALFGAGAEIKHLELEKRCLTFDVFLSKGNSFDDKELLMFLERNAGDICVVHRFSGVGQDSGEMERWGRVTFVTPNAAEHASALNSVPLSSGVVKVVPSKTMHDGDQNMNSSHLLKAKVHWPRRFSKGVAIVKCHPKDIAFMVDDFSSVVIGRSIVRCEQSIKCSDSIVIKGLDRELSEAEIFEMLTPLTGRNILDLFLIRGNAVEGPPLVACEEALRREISSFMPKRNPYGNSTRVQVFPPEPKDTYIKAAITFDGSLYLEAARALEEMNGKVLPGCLPWQKIQCQHLFSSSVSCPAAVYHVIKTQLDTLLASFRHRKGVECNLLRNENGSYRVTISAGATKIVAEVRKLLEQLMKGKIIDHDGITPTVLQHLFSREGIFLMKSVQQETGTYILFDRHTHTLRIFGCSNMIDMAEKKFVDLLLSLHENKQLEVHLRGEALPPNLMKRVVQKFGADLNGIKQMFPEGNFSLNVKHHCISISGPKEVKQKVEDVIYEMAQTSSPQNLRSDDEADCPICLCEVEEGFKLENCFHVFCRSCLVEQCESAIRSREGFPMCCMHKGCKAPILVADLKSLLSIEKLEELFRASLGAFVAASGGSYRFCPSPDCPSVYRAADPSATTGEPFICGACYAETCTSCHLEYHPFISCGKYREIKDDPDYNSLKAWKKGKENVKNCPVCSFTIEKVDGCNHIECKCGKHVCWVCLEFFATSDDCYNHLRSVHSTII